MYVTIRSSVAFLGADDNSHGQFHTTSFASSVESNLHNRGYFGNMLFRPKQPQLLDISQQIKWEWS